MTDCRKLAAAVLSSALSDAQAGDVVARKFLTDPTNTLLGLWCAWLDLNPENVARHVANILGKGNA